VFGGVNLGINFIGFTLGGKNWWSCLPGLLWMGSDGLYWGRYFA